MVEFLEMKIMLMKLTEWEAWCYIAMVFDSPGVYGGICYNIRSLSEAGYITYAKEEKMIKKIRRFNPLKPSAPVYNHL